MRKHLCIIALFMFVIVSCTPDEIGTPFLEGQEVTITASMANSTSDAKQMPGKQRVSGKDAGTQIDLTWDADDQITVTVGDQSAIFTLTSGAGSSQATFTGTMPADGVSFSVQYPVAEPDLSVQKYVENGFGKGLMKMATETNGTIDGGFTLKAQHALLGLQLKGSDALGKIMLINLADSKTYTLGCSGVTLTDEAALFYIVVPAGEWANGFTVDVYADDNTTIIKTLTKNSSATFSATEAMVMPEVLIKQYRYGFTQAEWDAATDSWGHGGRAHAPADQSCIQGTIVRGIRLKVGREGSIDVYKVPSLLETTTDNFQLVTTLTADSRGVTDFDFAHPIYIGKNEYLVFGHPLKSPPTLLPCYNPKSPSQPLAHFIGTEKAKMAGASLMVDFY